MPVSTTMLSTFYSRGWIVLRPGKLIWAQPGIYGNPQVCALSGREIKCGRLGIDIHATAGKGDVGILQSLDFGNFCFPAGQGLCEYAHWPIDLFSWWKEKSRWITPSKRPLNTTRRSSLPVESMMWKNRFLVNRTRSLLREILEDHARQSFGRRGIAQPHLCENGESQDRESLPRSNKIRTIKL